MSRARCTPAWIPERTKGTFEEDLREEGTHAGMNGSVEKSENEIWGFWPFGDT